MINQFRKLSNDEGHHNNTKPSYDVVTLNPKVDYSADEATN